jgi:hypothetical protein
MKLTDKEIMYKLVEEIIRVAKKECPFCGYINMHNKKCIAFLAEEVLKQKEIDEKDTRIDCRECNGYGQVLSGFSHIDSFPCKQCNGTGVKK